MSVKPPHWKPGDQYWALWLDATTAQYVPRCEGVVRDVDGRVLRLWGGTWRLVEEGFAFKSREAAAQFVAERAPQPDEEAAAQSTLRPSRRLRSTGS
jgi:hypothetical protein